MAVSVYVALTTEPSSSHRISWGREHHVDLQAVRVLARRGSIPRLWVAGSRVGRLGSRGLAPRVPRAEGLAMEQCRRKSVDGEAPRRKSQLSEENYAHRRRCDTFAAWRLRILMKLNGRLCILVLLKVDLLLRLSAQMVEAMVVLYPVSCVLLSMVCLCWFRGNVCAAFERACALPSSGFNVC
jgi:hypothetical protein